MRAHSTGRYCDCKGILRNINKAKCTCICNVKRTEYLSASSIVLVSTSGDLINALFSLDTHAINTLCAYYMYAL